MAWLGIVLAAGGFVLLGLSIWLNIHFLIPVGMIGGAALLLVIAKNMPSEPDKKDGGEGESDG